MRSPPPPIRFLLAAIAGWAALRVAILAPWGVGSGEKAAPAWIIGPAPGPAQAGAPPTEVVSLSRLHRSARLVPLLSLPSLPVARRPASASRPSPVPSADSGVVKGPGTNDGAAAPSLAEPQPTVVAAPPAFAPPAAMPRSRLSVSAWLFVRRGAGEPGLAPGGTLGGSQAGARATYRLSEGLAMSLRLYAPLHDARGGEAAVGVDWKPLGALPVHLLAERRARLGRDGRSAFGLVAYGGMDRTVGPFHLDAYGQAGMVGARRRDLFADGAVRLTVPAGRLRLGAGAWGAAQPGVSRLDAGPHVELNLRGAGNLTLAADWRFRLAGAARPGSGPAITLSTGF
jgi:hypothetical protein